MTCLFDGLLGMIGPLLEDLDGHDFFGCHVFALGNVTEAASEPEALELVLAAAAVQHIPGRYL